MDTFTLDGVSWWQCNSIEKVDISGNEIREIPTGLFEHLSDCRSFNANDNRLESLPIALLGLAKLKSLLLIRNKLTIFPTSESPSSLVELRLSHNNLCELPRGFADALPNLQALSIDHNRLVNLDEPLPTQLRVLLASSNELVSIRGVGGGLGFLEELDLSKNSLTVISDLRCCSQLSSVDLSHNKLVHWPSLGEKVHTLAFSYNSLESPPEAALLPPALVTLLLDNNKVKAVPGGVFALDKLKTLDMSNNDISRVPSELGRLPSLTKVALDGNPIRNVPMAVLRQGSAGLLKLLRERLGPDEVPVDDVQEALMTEVRNATHGGKRLDLSNRRLGPGIPEEVLQAEGLLVLDLSRNMVAEIEVLKSLDTLLRLVMSHNVLKTIDALNYPVLQELDISNNKLTKLPVEISLPQLVQFDASCNRELISLPKSLLTGCAKLRELRAGNCCLHSWDFLPDPEHPHLEVLDLSNNRFTDIPTDLVPTRLPGEQGSVSAVGQPPRNSRSANSPARQQRHSDITSFSWSGYSLEEPYFGGQPYKVCSTSERKKGVYSDVVVTSGYYSPRRVCYTELLT